MNLGDWRVGQKWIKLETLIGISLDSEKGYTIQNKGYSVLQACCQEFEPTDTGNGFIINTNQCFGYTKRSSNDYLWVKACNNNTIIVIQEGL